jgi:hypothetical protein
MEVIFLAHMSELELRRLAIDVNKLLGLVQENYKLQPAKSAVMSFNTNMENPGYNYTINNESIQKSDTIVHLGITHHRNYRKTTSTQLQQNIEKTRHT